jgi:hypothetical protein
LTRLEPETNIRWHINPMTISDSFLSYAGWLFFAVWSLMVLVVSIVAFGRDLLPRRAHLSPAPNSQATDQLRSTESTAL